MAELRPHGVLPDYELQIEGAVEGICLSSDAITRTVIFSIPSYSPDWRYGPAPCVGSNGPTTTLVTPAGHLLPVGARVLVIFPSNGRPWVIGWTNPP